MKTRAATADANAETSGTEAGAADADATTAEPEADDESEHSASCTAR